MSENFKWIVLTAISVTAAIFSILTYRRNRKLDNENHLFRIKMECYSNILGEITTFLNRLQDYVKRFKGYGVDTMINLEKENKINKLGKKVDDLIFSFDESITKNSLVVSKEVLVKLNEFSLKLFGTEIPEANSSKVEQIVQKLDEYIANVIVDANDINELMRLDLNVDALNLSLYRRIK